MLQDQGHLAAIRCCHILLRTCLGPGPADHTEHAATSAAQGLPLLGRRSAEHSRLPLQGLAECWGAVMQASAVAGYTASHIGLVVRRTAASSTLCVSLSKD